MDLNDFFQNIADKNPSERIAATKPIRERLHCSIHFQDLVEGVCLQCQEDKYRGYQVLMLAGRCANGSELDSGIRWHAVVDGKALCGAIPGRRSVGWSSYTKLHQEVTCPRCLKKINKKSQTDFTGS